MWRYVIALSSSLLFLMTIQDPLSAQQHPGLAGLDGRVIDAETGEPLRGAHIFLSGTKIGTITNAAGRYRINRIPPGAHRLIVSIIGYNRVSEELLLRSDERKNFEHKLDPVVYEMERLFVGNLDDRWERHLNRFYSLFIGQSGRADSVEILNPEVLRFESRWWGRFTAEALAPLVIENRSLGYRITYYLDEFEHSGTVTRWDGDPLFEEMTPHDSLQAERWESNRNEAFYGSMRHFLLSLTQDRLSDEGFEIYRIIRDTRISNGQNLQRTSARQLVTPHEEDPVFLMDFYGSLQVIYTEAGEDERYLQWANSRHRRPASMQTSHLELNQHPITVDPYGEILETYGATQFGYFSFLRIADKTPQEYLPENLPDYLIATGKSPEARSDKP